MEEVETTIARCMRDTSPAPESLTDLDEALVQQLLAGYAHPAAEPPPAGARLPDHRPERLAGEGYANAAARPHSVRRGAADGSGAGHPRSLFPILAPVAGSDV
jgi:hypothetical protein